jgi:hypothetical protein
MFNRKSSGILGRPVKPGDDDLWMDADQPLKALPATTAKPLREDEVPEI